MRFISSGNVEISGGKTIIKPITKIAHQIERIKFHQERFKILIYDELVLY
jgi:hypothetical protein